MRVLIAAVVVTFLFTGNAVSVSVFAATKEKVLNSSVSESVKIYFEGKPVGPYRAVGKILVKKTGKLSISKSRQKIEEEAREHAAALGGDAIIKWNEGPLYVNAIAVKYVGK